MNNETEPPSTITSPEPMNIVADPQVVPETLQTLSTATSGEAMVIH